MGWINLDIKRTAEGRRDALVDQAKMILMELYEDQHIDSREAIAEIRDDADELIRVWIDGDR